MKIEIAKSWFVLAQILAVISGLFIFSGGFFLISNNDIFSLIDTSFNLCDKVIKGNYSFAYNGSIENCLEEVFEEDILIESQKVSYFLILLGFILGMLSILIWGLGRWKLEDEEIPDKWFALYLLIIFIILILLTKYYINRLF